MLIPSGKTEHILIVKSDSAIDSFELFAAFLTRSLLFVPFPLIQSNMHHASPTAIYHATFHNHRGYTTVMLVVLLLQTRPIASQNNSNNTDDSNSNSFIAWLTTTTVGQIVLGIIISVISIIIVSCICFQQCKRLWQRICLCICICFPCCKCKCCEKKQKFSISLQHGRPDLFEIHSQMSSVNSLHRESSKFYHSNTKNMTNILESVPNHSRKNSSLHLSVNNYNNGIGSSGGSGDGVGDNNDINNSVDNGNQMTIDSPFHGSQLQHSSLAKIRSNSKKTDVLNETNVSDNKLTNNNNIGHQAGTNNNNLDNSGNSDNSKQRRISEYISSKISPSFEKVGRLSERRALFP